MRARRITGFLTLTLIAVTTAGVAIAAGTGTVTPPPRIAFVARSDLYPDALAAGPIAGRLGAPLFITAPTTLVPSVEQGLKDYAPELVIIAGDTTAISAGVELAIEAALNLAPDKVIRAAGATRHETAVALVELIGQYNPAFLPVDATAADADLLDGLDSAAFQQAGRAPAALLQGETLIGLYGLDVHTPAGGGDVGYVITFANPLPVDHVPATVITIGNPATGNCPGSAADPQAASGHLCLYEITGFGYTSLAAFEVGAGTGAGRYGFEVRLLGPGGDMYSNGVWAVTAPS
jgi:hypothetical protein